METRGKLVLWKGQKVLDLSVNSVNSVYKHSISDSKPIKINVKYILADDSRKSEFSETPL